MAAYDADYYESHCGQPYRRGDFGWEQFFGRVADELIQLAQPTTVLDAGCAIGFLVEALRARGVDARGIDISDYAIGDAPAELQPYLRVGSVADELNVRYDVIVCIEVLEHVSEDVGAAAVANFARHTDAVLFSSTPDDHDEPTHVNVQPLEHWIRLFARHGLLPDPDVDASFLTRHAVLFRRIDPDAFAVRADMALRAERARVAALTKQNHKFERRSGLRSRLARALRS